MADSIRAVKLDVTSPADVEKAVATAVEAFGRSRYRGFAKVELQNLFIGTACNIKRWLRIVAETKIDPKIDLLFFKNVLQRVQGCLWAIPAEFNFFSCPIRGVTFLTPA
jgi:NAD(P)-dependent dehydrogenase (short-subunit alcohol dehydrogenase family)